MPLWIRFYNKQFYILYCKFMVPIEHFKKGEAKTH